MHGDDRWPPRPTPAHLLPACLLILGIVAGCGELDDAFEPEPPVTIVAFEVWNRTREQVSLVDAAGRQIDVPACGQVAAAAFQLDQVTVRTARGYWFSFASPAPPGDARRPQFLVLTAGGETLPGTTYDRPVHLPACDGLPAVDPGG